MPVEIRQMVVKSTVVQAHGDGSDVKEAIERENTLRREVLEECRRWITELQNDPKER